MVFHLSPGGLWVPTEGSTAHCAYFLGPPAPRACSGFPPSRERPQTPRPAVGTAPGSNGCRPVLLSRAAPLCGYGREPPGLTPRKAAVRVQGAESCSTRGPRRLLDGQHVSPSPPEAPPWVRPSRSPGNTRLRARRPKRLVGQQNEGRTAHRPGARVPVSDPMGPPSPSRLSAQGPPHDGAVLGPEAGLAPEPEPRRARLPYPQPLRPRLRGCPSESPTCRSTPVPTSCPGGGLAASCLSGFRCFRAVTGEDGHRTGPLSRAPLTERSTLKVCSYVSPFCSLPLTAESYSVVWTDHVFSVPPSAGGCSAAMTFVHE